MNWVFKVSTTNPSANFMLSSPANHADISSSSQCKTYDGQKRKKLVWWTLLLMVLLAGLLPAELVAETGIFEKPDCTPTSILSTGICATPWRGNGNLFVSSTSLLTSRAKWVDEKWETLLEGSRKSPVVNEVRRRTTLKPGRRVVLTDCTVQYGPCTGPADCGTMTVWKSSGPYNSIVTRTSLLDSAKLQFSLGDVTYDGSMGMAFIFWEGRKRENKKRRYSISAAGIETVLNKKETDRLARAESRPWNLTVDPLRSRTYEVSCITDGMGEDDLAHGLTIYRSMQLEQPGIQRSDVQSNISRVTPVTANDVIRSAYALKSEDGSRTCSGEIDVYEPCGSFLMDKGMPFIGVGIAVTILWIFVQAFVKDREPVPHDAASWRELAHNQARMLKYFLEATANEHNKQLSHSYETERAVYSEFNGPQHILTYSHKKFDFHFPEPDFVKIQVPGITQTGIMPSTGNATAYTMGSAAMGNPGMGSTAAGSMAMGSTDVQVSSNRNVFEVDEGLHDGTDTDEEYAQP